MAGSRITRIKSKNSSDYRKKLNRKIKAILVIAQLFPPDMGGGSTRAYNAVKSLVNLGQRVTVITAFPHYPTGDIPKKYRWKLFNVETIGSIKVIRVWVPSLASKGLARRFILFTSFLLSSLFALPLIGHIDVIWASNPNIFSVYSALIYRLFKHCPIVQNVDDLWPEELYNLKLLKSSIFKRIAQNVSSIAYLSSKAITPISPSYIDIIVNSYNIDKRKIVFIPTRVDLEIFKKINADIKKEKGLFRVLYIGALSVVYNFDYVLKAAHLLTSDSSIRFVIQGIGDLGDSIQVKVREMGLQNVDIVLKIVKRVEVARIMSSADILLLPLRDYEYSGLSTKLYEYQSAGKPIICCSRGQPGRYVSETRSGIVVKPGNYKDLAKAILYLKKNRSIAKKMGNSGREYVEKHLTLEQIGIRLMKVLDHSSFTR